MTKPYPEYKDSGVEWLGEVPSHWEIDRLKWSLTICKNGVWGDDPAGDENDIPCVRVADFDRVRLLVGAEVPTIRNVRPEQLEGRVLRKGDLVLEKSGGGEQQSVGCVVLYAGDGPATCSNFVARMEVAPGMVPSFWRYVHAAAYSFGLPVASIKQNTGIQNLDQSQYLDERAPFPPGVEQSAIATFLDRETGKIDALVAEQEKLIELSKEKRQAVISHAITKGLDPTVPMKDSGIEWLGEVPAHWDVSRVKHLCSHVVDCLHTTPTYDGDLEYPAIRTADLDRGVLLLDQARLVSREVYEERIQRLCPVAGDILYSREGERFGMAALVPEGVDLCLGQRMMLFRVNQMADAAFTMWLLNSDTVYKQVLEKVGGSTSPHVNISDIINFHVPLPPFDEQLKIAEHIAMATSSVDNLTAEAQRAIGLLKERRTALISAAVTGKIDVRGLADAEPPEKALEPA